MNIKAARTDLKNILPLRESFLQENHFQIRYHAVHERKWSDSWLFTNDEIPVGYAAIQGREERADRDSIFEFFLLQPYRRHADEWFRNLVEESGARYIQAQTNERQLTAILFECCHSISCESILFAEGAPTHLVMEGVLFRKKESGDVVFPHTTEPEGDWVLDRQGEIIATGGFLLHYNKPFADLYMEVKPEYRRQGMGSYLIQELKEACRLAGRIPAARTDPANRASRATLLKGGMDIAGHMLTGEIRK